MERQMLNRSDIVFINGKKIEGYIFGSFSLYALNRNVSLTLFRFDGGTQTYDPKKTPLLILRPFKITPITNEAPVKISNLTQARWKILHFNPHPIQEKRLTTGKD